MLRDISINSAISSSTADVDKLVDFYSGYMDWVQINFGTAQANQMRHSLSIIGAYLCEKWEFQHNPIVTYREEIY